jgi:hypothetical protein
MVLYKKTILKLMRVNSNFVKHIWSTISKNKTSLKVLFVYYIIKTSIEHLIFVR